MGLTRTTSHPATDTLRDNPKVRLPTHRLADHGLGGEFAREAVSSELLLDGSARLNLATFVTTWMPENAERLMAQTADKNMIDKDEYPQTATIEARCVNIIADLWNAPDCDQAKHSPPNGQTLPRTDCASRDASTAEKSTPQRVTRAIASRHSARASLKTSMNGAPSPHTTSQLIGSSRAKTHPRRSGQPTCSTTRYDP